MQYKCVIIAFVLVYKKGLRINVAFIIFVKGLDTLIFTESLKKNYKFRLVYNKGKSIANRTLVMYILKCGENKNYFGITVGKKVGNSVVRSRVTRLIRESYRLSEKNIKSGYNIVVIARVNAKESSFDEINKSLNHLFKKHDLKIPN